MAQAKRSRTSKRQYGQFLTPQRTADRIVGGVALHAFSVVLEPSFGTGSFLLPLIARLVALRPPGQSARARFVDVCRRHVYGVEIDPGLYRETIGRIERRWGPLPSGHRLVCDDFFRVDFPSRFDLIVGNPPFGGTFDPAIEPALDRMYGRWEGTKVKKETYAFFIARARRLLVDGGKIVFICSDTMLTVKTMLGLRQQLMGTGLVSVDGLPVFSAETSTPTILLSYQRSTGPASYLTRDGARIGYDLIRRTPNMSWGITPELASYFNGRTVGDKLVCSGGMVTGDNTMFLRRITNGMIVEPYEFEFYDERVTVEGERARSKLGRLTPEATRRAIAAEQAGETRRAVRTVPCEPTPIALPHPDYRVFNKSQPGRIVYGPPEWAIYWADGGEAVRVWKQNAKEGQRGIGGRPYFGREGVTWSLVASEINARYLPAGQILDAGAPAAFTRPGVNRDEMFFVLGWLLTPLATKILKTVVNHTRNIQGKDIERLPYPTWVNARVRREAIQRVHALVEQAQRGAVWGREDPEILKLVRMFDGN